jgi:putative glutamine amidotransferase
MLKNSSRPLIGIIPDYKEGGDNTYSTRPFYALRHNYVDMINKAGGAAVILTYDYDAIDDYIASLDGVVVVGGYFDIHPKRYGEGDAMHPTVKLNDVRENFEYEFGKKVFKTNLPFFGICNGMQLINVLHGGKVIQHIPDNKDLMDHEQSHHPEFKNYAKGYHAVNVAKGSRLHQIVGQDSIDTNSSHHQAAKNAGIGLSAVGHADDGVIEAVEKADHPFCIGVQWHPEFEVSQADRKLFEEFIRVARQHKISK